MIDLTNGGNGSRPRLAMFGRYPPSASGAASASSALADTMTRRFGIPVEVIRLVMPGETGGGGHRVVMDVNPGWHLSARLAAQRANRCDVALFRVDRHIPLSLVGDFVEELAIPVVLCVDDVGMAGSEAATHLAALVAKVEAIVVPSDVARRRLEGLVGDTVRIEVIPHGSSLGAMTSRTGPRRQLLTWGFLGPALGAERVIRAIALLSDLDPLPRYRLVGVADPGWTRHEASSYRKSLVAEAERLGIADQVEMVPMLHSSERLGGEIERSDLIVVPYDSQDRAASRILTEAVSTGRPVVATAFPAAIELLASGAGVTVAHDSDEDMAGAIRRYLTDDDAYSRAARVARAFSARLSWEEAARSYAKLIAELVDSPELVSENTH